MSRKSRLKAAEEATKVLVKHFNEASPEEQKKLFKQWVYLKVTVGLVGLTFFFYQFILYLVRNSNSSNLDLASKYSEIATLLCILIGIFLYFLRTWYQYIYGIFEVGFAISSLWYLLQNLPAIGIHSWLAIFGALYVLVRGIDNLVCGLKDPIKKTG